MKSALVIGLGMFGMNIAVGMMEQGWEVLAVDVDERRVKAMIPLVTRALVADCTNEEALDALGVSNFDVVVCSCGRDVQASAMITLLLNEKGAKYILAKANSETHRKLLEKLGATRVVFPEQDMALKYAAYLCSGNVFDYFELSDEYSIVEQSPPASWVGKNVKELSIRSRFGITILAFQRNGKITALTTVDHVIEKDEVLVMLGSNESLEKLNHLG